MSDETALLIFALWAFATGHWIVGLIAVGLMVYFILEDCQ